MLVTMWLVLSGESNAIAQGNGHSVTGQLLYHTHCASCHGESGRGDGMVGAALRTPPTDLTVLAGKNGGVFPEAAVVEFIDGTRAVTAHGPRAMPVWGMMFQDHNTIHKIVDYIRGLQQM
jgi:mono/diheme cytochrome c family protein